MMPPGAGGMLPTQGSMGGGAMGLMPGGMGGPPPAGAGMHGKRKKRMTMDEFDQATNALKSKPAQPVEVRRHFLVQDGEIAALTDASQRWIFARKQGYNSE